ncbi:MAG: hypothetical protein ACLSHC_15540 [Bilophila wadsworthia]
MRRALKTPPKQRQPLGPLHRNISPCRERLQWVNAVWDTVAYGVFFQHMETETHRNRSRATPEEIALGRRAFFAMLDVLKPDFVIVWGLTLFKQHWLSPESGITMLAPGLCAYVFTDRPDVRIWHCHHPSRDFSLFRTK